MFHGLAQRVAGHVGGSLGRARPLRAHWRMCPYMTYHNEARTHLLLSKDAPIPREVQSVGRIFAKPHLGGLHHQYVRI
jgi:hypothetical protein